MTRPAAARMTSPVAAVFTASCPRVRAARRPAARAGGGGAPVARGRLRRRRRRLRRRLGRRIGVGVARLLALGRRGAGRRGARRRVEQLRRHERLERGQRRLALARHQRHLAVLVAELLFADVVVLRVRLDHRIDAVAQDARPDEDHQVGLDLVDTARLEELANDRNRAEERHLLLLFTHLVGDQAAEHDDAAVLHQHLGGDGALVRDQVGRADLLRARREVRGLLRDLERDRVALVDLRRDLEDVADFLARDRLEGVIYAATGRIGA